MKIISLFTGKLWTMTMTWRRLRCSAISLPQFSLANTLRPWTSRQELGERSFIHCKRRLNLNIDSPNKMQPRVLREMADVVAKAKFPGKLHLLVKRVKRRALRTAKHSASPLCPVRSWNRQIFLAVMLKHMEDGQVIKDSQHGLTKGKLCLTNFVAVYSAVVCEWIREEQLTSTLTSLRPLIRFPKFFLLNWIYMDLMDWLLHGWGIHWMAASKEYS